jgi:hypothetical protein
LEKAPLSSQFAQFVLEHFQEPFGGDWVATLDGQKDLRDSAHEFKDSRSRDDWQTIQ